MNEPPPEPTGDPLELHRLAQRLVSGRRLFDPTEEKPRLLVGRILEELADVSVPERSVALPKRWIVERSLVWIPHNRRLSKDYEYEGLCSTGEALVYAAMTRLMVRKLARTPARS